MIELYDLAAGIGSELANISIRGFVATGSKGMIAGFIVANSSSENDQVIVRGLGPSLGAFRATNPLTDPLLELHDVNGTLIASNDDWQDGQQSEIEAVGLAPSEDVEAARIMTLPPGAYRDRERQGRRHRRGLGRGLQSALSQLRFGKSKSPERSVGGRLCRRAHALFSGD
ncbi:MAG: hypothetical protein ABIU29_10030 [Chthoniobacterales bacterium]